MFAPILPKPTIASFIIGGTFTRTVPKKPALCKQRTSFQICDAVVLDAVALVKAELETETQDLWNTK
jgi:hypothetical protein